MDSSILPVLGRATEFPLILSLSGKEEDSIPMGESNALGKRKQFVVICWILILKTIFLDKAMRRMKVVGVVRVDIILCYLGIIIYSS